MVAMPTHTPGSQVGLYKAHGGIRWWSSEKLEPRIPLCVNVPFAVSQCTKVSNVKGERQVDVWRFFPMYENQRGSSSTMQMARGECLKGDNKMGCVKVYQWSPCSHTHQDPKSAFTRPIVVSNGGAPKS